MATAVCSPIKPLPRTIDALTPGLLLFFDRPSPLQTWAELFGAEWRHVGITVQTDEGLMIANYAYPQMFYCLPVDILASYRRIGVARVFSNDQEREMFEGWTGQFSDTSASRYTLSAPLVGPIHVLARRCNFGPLKWTLLIFISVYCRALERRYRDNPAFVCSTFIWAAIHAARSEPMHIPMVRLSDDQDASAPPPTTLDIRLARWLASPTDIWDAVATSDRADLDLTIGCPTQSEQAISPPDQAGLAPDGSGSLVRQFVFVAVWLRFTT